ncbi:MAG: alkaline phosphatase family protein, partial [Vicinamibacterales bacterium]
VELPLQQLEPARRARVRDHHWWRSVPWSAPDVEQLFSDKPLASSVILALPVGTPQAQASITTSAQARAAGLKLIVFISVDQMRGDYIDKFRHQWTKGLKRMVSEGAWFREADYPYFNTVTCAGHASMSTGTLPAVHGMILNTWWDRAAQKVISCTDDESKKLITYGGPARGVGHSAERLLTTTIADELRLQLRTPPRAVSISLKARSAINLGGHRPDAVIWLDEETAEWVTSTAFAKGPAPFFAEYINAHPVRGEISRTWDRLLPRDQYLYEESAIGRQRTALATTGFPHLVRGKGNELDGSFSDAWESSPYSDAYLAALASHAVDALRLGRNNTIDFLGISFSALDKVGHDFGPQSHEVQDVLIRLDREVGTLLEKLDRDVGIGNYTVALTADHGVGPVPEQMAAQGFDAGRISATAVGWAVDDVLTKLLGPGTRRTRVLNTDIYFTEGVYQQLVQNPSAMEAVLETIRRTPGVWRVYRKEALLGAGNDPNPLVRAAALGYFEGRSGDLIMLQRSYWITSTSTATHGTGHRYDTRVPVLLFGRGIAKGEYLQPAAPIDLAPTLALLAGITLPDARGRVLAEALK